MVASVLSSSCIWQCSKPEKRKHPHLVSYLKSLEDFPRIPEEKSPHVSLARSSNLPVAKQDWQVDGSPRLGASLFLHSYSLSRKLWTSSGCAIYWFWVYSESCTMSLLSNYRTYSLPPTKPCAHCQSIPSHPPPALGSCSSIFYPYRFAHSGTFPGSEVL